MIIIKLSGGLGNQLFQYAFGRSMQIRHNAILKFDLSGYSGTRNERTYMLERFGLRIARANTFELFRTKLFGSVTRESRPNYIPEITKINKGLFVGNWQSEMYFADISNIIRNELSQVELGRHAQEIRKSIDENSVSIHIRRGDYVSDQKTNNKHGVCPPEYYSKAIDYIRSKITNPHFYVSSDDIDWVKKNMNLSGNTTYISSKDLSDVDELTLMSNMRYHITANSTYSWWSAWLDPRLDKIVVTPAKWFNLSTDTSDLIPSGWTKI